MFSGWMDLVYNIEAHKEGGVLLEERRQKHLGIPLRS